ncbi:MAG: peptidylprolyl isomerase [Planctomycetaceae bacterium]|nr:peptidylprolyl isomerase [Planctomycetaceae bacterium]
MSQNRRAEVDEAIADVDFDANNYQVVFDTSMGKITVNLLPEVAPGHCKNIIGLTRIGFYNGIIFHRVIRGFMNQVGCPLGTGTGGPGYTIDAEFSDTPHVPGTLSMARTADPNSAGSQIFICNAPAPSLNGSYTVFGQTADDESLAVVVAIGDVATGPNDRPSEDVTINDSCVLATPK